MMKIDEMHKITLKSTAAEQSGLTVDIAGAISVGERLRIARVLRGSMTYAEAINFARKMGEEPNSNDVKELMPEENAALGKIIYDKGNGYGWAHLSDRPEHQAAEEQLFYYVGAFQGGRWAFIGVGPDGNANWVIWKVGAGAERGRI